MTPEVENLDHPQSLSLTVLTFRCEVGEPCPDNPSQAASRAFREPSKQICEGRDPPPIAIHGPKSSDLSNQEKSDFRKLHQNLGHPDPMLWQTT